MAFFRVGVAKGSSRASCPPCFRQTPPRLPTRSDPAAPRLPGRLFPTVLYARGGSDARIGSTRGAKLTACNHQPNAELWSETSAHSRTRALGVAATTDNICGLRLAFAIRAAIIAVFLGDAVATWMGAFLWIFHAHPTCTSCSEFLHGDLVAAVVAARVGIDAAVGVWIPFAPLVIVTIGIAVSRLTPTR